MKTKILIIGGLATLAGVAAPMAASAQHWRGDGDRGRYERWERHDEGRAHWGDRRYDDRPYPPPPPPPGYADRHYAPPPPPPPGRAHGGPRWYRGAAIPPPYRSQWYMRDYHRYGYGPPPRGYGYYRTDTGDIVLAALATGVIISLLD